MIGVGSGSAPPRKRVPGGSGQSGAALLTVLVVLTVLGIAVTILMDRSRGDIRPWARESENAQALYAAESGIAFQLYLERYSDSAEPSFGKGAEAEAEAEKAAKGNPDPLLGGAQAPTDTFSYRLDTLSAVPEVRVDRTRAYLDIVSKGRFRNAEATVTARFGKALDDSVFGPALTLDNTEPLEPFSAGQVIGTMRMRMPSPGMPSVPWPQGFTTSAYTAEFADKRYGALESALQKKLGEQGGEGGNGNFTRTDPPVFPAGGDLFFPLGRVELVNHDDEPWVLKGPGRIFCDGEIRIKGLIRLENVQLLSGKDITFEDSVTGDGISAFARGSIFFHNRCNLGIEAVAGKDIVLRDRCQTNLGSVLLSVGNRHLTKGADTLNAIRIVNEAVARGFLIAGGANGRVALATQANIVEGVVIAAAVWLSGEVRGPVLTRKLLCEGANRRNCLGPGRINRNLLPANFVQPLQLGSQDRRLYVFKLMEWKRS
jgi:type II secretory pathway pseudopilin PulG